MKHSPLRHVLSVLRLKIGYGQKEMAALVSCSRATIQAVELGHLKLSKSLALRISLETGVEVGWLLDNNLEAPVRLADEAALLVEQATGVSYSKMVYTQETFDLIRAHRHDESGPRPIWSEVCRGFQDHAYLRGIMESARSRHLFQLARYKLDKFLEELHAEFGFANQLVGFQESYPGYDPKSFEVALEFFRKELLAALACKRSRTDHRDPDAIPPKEREDLEKLLILFRVASPYENPRSPEVIERVNKEYAEQIRMLSEAKAAIEKRL